MHIIYTESELNEIAESIPDSFKIPASKLKLSSTAIGQGKVYKQNKDVYSFMHGMMSLNR